MLHSFERIEVGSFLMIKAIAFQLTSYFNQLLMENLAIISTFIQH